MGHEWNEMGPASAAALGEVNGEPSDTEPFEGAMEPEPGDAEYPQPAHVQDGERAASENLRDLVAGDAVPGVYPAPQPAHVRDGLNTVALGEVYEQRHTEYVPAAVHQVLANRFQLERTAKRAAEEELEQARRLIGQGPFVIVKLNALPGAGDGEVEVKVGFGGGVTRHMLESVLSIGLQAVRESLPPGARAEQEDTVRLPVVDDQPTARTLAELSRTAGESREPDPCSCLGCSWEQSAQKPQEDTGSQEDTVRLPGYRDVADDAPSPFRPLSGPLGPQPAQKPQESTGIPDPRDVPPGY